MTTETEAVRRLMAAAARSGAELVAEAAALVDGWAVLVDPLAGAVHSTPANAAGRGVHAALTAETDPALLLRPVAGAVLVIHPAETTPARLANAVARTTTALLDVRARRAAEMQAPEMRLHTAALGLLLCGKAHLAAEILGAPASTHTTVYRLTGPDHHTQAAYQALWRAVRPLAASHTLIGRIDTELAIADLHVPGQDDGRTLRLVSRTADRYHLLGGVADPSPLDLLPAAWADARSARQRASPSHRLAPAATMGTHGLLNTFPPQRFAAWAAAVLHPLDHDQRHLLTVWLRAGSIQHTAPIIGVSAGTVRTRLHTIARTLRTDLTHATVQAHLLLALRTPLPTTHTPLERPPAPLDSIPEHIRTSVHARAWARSLADGLETHLRIALRCWLAHCGRTAPAAAELRLHRTTLTQWLDQAADTLGLDLATATVRAELHLAIEIIADPTDVPATLPRRGGRTYQAP
ncbi:hypothetical protein TPA0906_00200 [Streptomyces olivaceus]|uniref:helix-turn-helix domain-containing protein n=1 Tax=Streptomyces olivaceus TaxID=47716 RepID=UPI0022EE1449|nr:PucR family transcriptional regulator [Streptomyces olivaceus]GHI98154.1 hypothetical protein TPA0906_00200 [Streptomyces olivaceus]